MKSFLIDTDRLGACMLRQVPAARPGQDGAPQVDEHGQPILLGRLLIPGVATSSYAEPGPRQVRVKIAGQLPDGLVDGSVVRLAGRVLITSWFLRGGRGLDARSQVTVSPERIELADGEVPAFQGFLPVRVTTDDPFIAMSWRPRPDGTGFECALVVPSSIIDEAGTVTVLLDQQPPEGIEGRQVHLEDPLVKVVQPESEDVGRASKAGFELHAVRLVPVELAAAGATTRRRSEPVAAEQSPPNDV